MFAWQFAKALYLAGRHADPLRLDAEPLQPRLPRGGARDAAALPRGGDRRHTSPAPAWTRSCASSGSVEPVSPDLHDTYASGPARAASCRDGSPCPGTEPLAHQWAAPPHYWAAPPHHWAAPPHYWAAPPHHWAAPPHHWAAPPHYWAAPPHYWAAPPHYWAAPPHYWAAPPHYWAAPPHYWAAPPHYWAAPPHYWAAPPHYWAARPTTGPPAPLLGRSAPLLGRPPITGPLAHGRSGPLVGQSRYSGRQSSDLLRQSARLGERPGAFQGRRAGELEDRRRCQGAPGEGLGGSGGLLGRRHLGESPSVAWASRSLSTANTMLDDNR